MKMLYDHFEGTTLWAGNLKKKKKKSVRKLLSECPRGEHFSYEVEGLVVNINPGGIELYDTLVLEGTEEMNL